MTLVLVTLNKDGKKYYIEAYSLLCSQPILVTNAKEYKLTVTQRIVSRSRDKKRQDVPIYEGYIDARESVKWIRARCGCGNCSKKWLSIKTEQFTRLASLTGAYTVKGSVYVQKRPRRLVMYERNFSNHIILEAIFLIRLLFNWRIDAVRAAFIGEKRGPTSPLRAIYIIIESIATIPRAYVLRVTYYIYRRQKTKPLWIVSDRGAAAGDNGEAFYRYALKESGDRDLFFAISKFSRDHARMSRVGPVLHYGGLRYKMKFLLADFIISSQADIEVINPFLRQRDHFVDLFTFDFIFLQHGIIRNDLSGWLNRYERNIRLFVTSANMERESLLAYPYYYNENQLALTGLPRYDALKSNPLRKVIIAPTYRAYLLNKPTNRMGVRAYDSSFKKSDFYTFYNKLINDKRVLAAMKRYGYTGQFLLHPVFAAQLNDFQFNDRFQLVQFPYDYKTSINEGSLLITDYSSIVFDFAYLKKPVIYAKFDEDVFFSGHTYERADFFTDEADGFGNVVYSYEELVEAIVESLHNECVMEDMYKNRVDSFFYKQDQYNCRRVYEAVLDIEYERV